MKIRTMSALALSSLLFLTSCGNSEPVITGEVVACNHITLIPNPTQEVVAECLDSSPGVNIAAIKGPAIINVWGSWCDPCKEELPYFSEFYQTMDRQIQLIGVDVEEKRIEDGRMFARTHGIMWPNLYDADGSTRKYFGMGVPVTWFIDGDGKVLYKKIGPFKSTEELRTMTFKYFGLRG
ncbi:TrxA Thiol-disulfide isomerase and thioredoxins [Candidatus Nanopelagicaceae bacterium]